MPNLMAWNIETFGANRLLRGNYNGVLAFIEILLRRTNMDVLIIEEFRQRGVQYLVPLMNALDAGGGDWYFDYLPGSVVTDTRPNVAFGDLGYTTAGNLEGYAIFSNGVNTLQSFNNRMSATGHLTNQSDVNLVTLGRRVAIDRHQAVPLTPNPLGGNANNLGFPLPSASVIGSRKRLRSGRVVGSASTIMSMTLSRCPCYCRVNSGGGQVPFVVYHAPNGSMSSFYGALLCALAESLQGNGDAVAGGDFNVTAPTQVTYGFNNFTGADQMTAGTHDGTNYAPSMVKYVDNVFNPQNLISANTKAECLGQARDQLFYRLGQAPNSVGVMDLVGMLDQTDPNYNANLANDVLASNDIRNMVRQATANNRLPAIVRGTPAAINDLNNTFTAPPAAPAANFANYRTIAIFLNAFISDHLPLFINL